MRLDPGYSFTTNENVTPTKFHSMVDDAFLKECVNADLDGFQMIYTATPGSPTAGDVRVGSSGEFEFYSGAAWVTQPPDTITLTLTNKSGGLLLAGDVVVVDHANSASFTVASVNPAPDVIGVLAANIANNASGLVIVRGFCIARIVPTDGAGSIMRGPNGTSSNADVKVAATLSTQIRSDAFGITLSDSGGSGTTAYETCYIWK